MREPAVSDGNGEGADRVKAPMREVLCLRHMLRASRLYLTAYRPPSGGAPYTVIAIGLIPGALRSAPAPLSDRYEQW